MYSKSEASSLPPPMALPTIFRSLPSAFAILCVLLFAFSPQSRATVVRPAPDFQWISATGSLESASKFRKQPIVVLIAPSPRTWAFRSQVGQLQRVYQRLSATGAVCVAAFTEDPGVIRSNIPFVRAQDGPRVAFLYGVQSGFGVAVIGKDGNLDIVSTRVLSGQRILDIIGNSFALQQALRRD